MGNILHVMITACEHFFSILSQGDMLLAEIPIATTTTIVLMGMMQDLVYVAT